jgi:SulP family sulfate permease
MKNSFISFIESISKPGILFPNVMAAAVMAVMNVTTAISIGALVFCGSLAPHLSTGIGLYLVGTVVGGLLIAMLSGYKAVIAGPRSGQAPIVASLAAGIALTMQGQPDAEIVATVMAGILATTVFIGIILYAIGWAKLGGMVRYIPYPVMGGFFAGLGYLLLKGGILVTVGPLVSADDISSFMSMSVSMHLAPAIAFALFLYVLEQRVKHWLLMPLYIAATIAIFYSTIFATGVTVEMAAENFWLPVLDDTDTTFIPVFTLNQLELVNWSAVFGQASTIFVMVLISVIMLLLGISGVEIAVDRKIDPNRELKAAGLGNIVSGLSTGVLGMQSPAGTAFAFKLGGTRFIMILAYTVFVGSILAAGPGLIAYVPTLLLGGLLIFIGLDFLMKWVWYTRKTLPKKDHVVVFSILLVVIFFGILEGIAVGLMLAIILFVHSYSQLSVIKNSISGNEYISNIDRDVGQTQHLNLHNSEIQIIMLQNFLFFGTSSRLLEDIETLLDDPSRPKIRYLVLDFYRVVAMDTSAANSFKKLLQICNKKGLYLNFTGCSTDISERFGALEGFDSGTVQTMRVFDALDDGVSWCSDKILENLDAKTESDDGCALLAQLLGDKNAADIVSQYFKEASFSEGHLLFRQNQPGDSLYLILQGSISIILDMPNEKKRHLRTMRSGAILGEIALYSGTARTASALVNEDCILFRLDYNSYLRMIKNSPVEAGFFHTFIIRLMSERLGRADREIIALLR